MLYTFLFSIVLLLNFLLSLIVLLKNPKKHINVAFFLFVFSLILWMIANYFSNLIRDPVSAFYFNKLIFIFSPYITFSLVYFSLVFPKDLVKINRVKLFYLIIPVLISNILTWTNLVITDITFLNGGGTGVVFGVGAIFFVAQFLLYLLFSFVVLFKKYRKSTGYERAQMQYVIFGVGITMLLSAITNLIIPLALNNFWFSNTGPFFTLIMVGFITYSIIRHRLLEVGIVLVRSVIYTLLIISVAALYTIGIFFMSQYLFRKTVSFEQNISYAVLAIFVAFTFIPLKNFIENATNRVFFKGRYDQHDLVFQLTNIIATTINLEELTSKTLTMLLSSLRVTHGAFIIYKSHKFTVYSQGASAYSDEKKTIDALYGLNKMVIFDEEKNKKVKELMRVVDAAIVLPLFERREKVGILLLGEKKSGQIYSYRDIGVLEIFGPVVSVAIQNAKSYEAIRNFNRTLKKEVLDATKDLEKVNKKLRELGRQKDEFMAIASHELKTPVTSIKLYTQLLHQKFKKINDTKSAESVAKMDMQLNKLISLINDLLDVTKIEEGKLQFNMDRFDLNELVGEIVEQMQLTTKHKIVKELEPIGEVYADRERIGQVLTNFISNAVKYSPEANKVVVRTAKDRNNIIASVQDFGMGLAPSEQKKVFERFNRAGQEGPGGLPGLGLGLYISREIIMRHEGKIWMESTKRKGSTFHFSIPISSLTDSSKK